MCDGPAKAGHYVRQSDRSRTLRTEGHAERFGKMNRAAAGEL